MTTNSNILNFDKERFLILAGSPGSGKSQMIKYILKQMKKKIDLLYIFCSVVGSDDDFPNVNDDYKSENYSDEKIKKIMKHCRDEDKKCCIVFDDMINAVSFDSKMLNTLMNNYRHYNISIIISSQFINKLPPNIRENAHYAIIFPQKSKKSLEATRESFLYSFDDTKEVDLYLKKKLKKDYQCLIYDTYKEKEEIFKAPKNVKLYFG